jgi:spermidine synthase
MKPWIEHASATLPDGGALSLLLRDTEWLIRANGRDLMSSRMHGSEEEMARLVRVERAGARVLVGGLGLGFTLRAALDTLPEAGRCTVVELIQAVVDWNRGPLGPLANHPVNDPRTDVIVADIATVLRGSKSRWDAILMDVDNGPAAFTQDSNNDLYTVEGLISVRRALAPGGAVAVWSAFDDLNFEKRMRRAGFRTELHRVRARGDRGPKHFIYVGRLGAPAT